MRPPAKLFVIPPRPYKNKSMADLKREESLQSERLTCRNSRPASMPTKSSRIAAPFLRRLNQALRESGAAEWAKRRGGLPIPGVSSTKPSPPAGPDSSRRTAHSLEDFPWSATTSSNWRLRSAISPAPGRSGRNGLAAGYPAFCHPAAARGFEPADLPVAPESVGHGVSEMLAAQGRRHGALAAPARTPRTGPR